MDIFSTRVRIGEKIGFSFGLVGVLFLAVIWQYHNTLEHSLGEYQRLLDVFEAKKSNTLEIENRILSARRAQVDFVLHRQEAMAEEVINHLYRVLAVAAEMRTIDKAGAQTAAQITSLIETYDSRFRAIAEAWREKGLDHNSGLQGNFRKAVHELEAMAANHKVGRLYLQLLQIRRGEKDLGLRREDIYRSKVLELVREFEKKTDNSGLEKRVKSKLLEEIAIYRETFDTYADKVLANADIKGGKGPFRQAAHRIEALLNQHYVPDLENNILQLRRREKDYLLRGDEKYIEMVQTELDRIRHQVDTSLVSLEVKSRFMLLLDNYQRDFVSLVEKNDHIAKLTEEIGKVVTKIAILSRKNVDNANLAMSKVAANINASSKQHELVLLAIVALSTLLGIFFAVLITRQIVSPVRKMAGLLDQLAYEEPAERVPYIEEGRDELNAMAKSVNTMADHKSRFISWWKTSMREADACKGLEALLREGGEGASSTCSKYRESLEELLNTTAEKRKILVESHHAISENNSNILNNTEQLMKIQGAEKAQDHIRSTWESANTIRNILSVISPKRHQDSG